MLMMNINAYEFPDVGWPGDRGVRMLVKVTWLLRMLKDIRLELVAEDVRLVSEDVQGHPTVEGCSMVKEEVQ